VSLLPVKRSPMCGADSFLTALSSTVEDVFTRWCGLRLDVDFLGFPPLGLCGLDDIGLAPGRAITDFYLMALTLMVEDVLYTGVDCAWMATSSILPHISVSRMVLILLSICRLVNRGDVILLGVLSLDSGAASLTAWIVHSCRFPRFSPGLVSPGRCQSCSR